jgi:transposase
MIIIGCDYHPGVQQIAWVDTDTGEFQETRLQHREQAEKFYGELAIRGVQVRLGMEASGQARWFERLLAELQMELWIGDAAEIRARRVRKKKTDREDARHILRLLVEDRFPRIWVPSWENRDVRQLLWHRHRMVQMRTRIMNQLQAVALNEGLRCKKRLWREKGRQQLESFPLAAWGSRRRRDLLEILDRLSPTIAELTQAIEAEVAKLSCCAATDDASRSGCADGPGLCADHRRDGTVSVWQADRGLSGSGSGRKLQRGKPTARTYQQTREWVDAFLAVEAAQVTVRSDGEWRSKYFHVAMRRGRKIANVAMARRLAVRLYWMWRKQWDYEQLKKFGPHAGQPGMSDGVK